MKVSSGSVCNWIFNWSPVTRLVIMAFLYLNSIQYLVGKAFSAATGNVLFWYEFRYSKLLAFVTLVAMP